MARLLVVDDEENMRRILRVFLEKDGHSVAEAGDVSGAQRMLTAQTFELLLTDQRLPDGEGLSLVNWSRDIDPNLPVILLTAYASVDLAVAALREGAFDFLTKPFNPGVVRGAVDRAVQHVSLLRENNRLRDELSRVGKTGNLVGKSAAMAVLRDYISRVAPTGATVMIMGETGTGKELVARAIHESSPRAAKPFIAVNCAAFSEQLLESQLFGHERGAFTGADRAHRGFFEAADQGTLFLDEAGEMSLGLQAKLLRVLMDGEVMRVGATAARKVDVRVLVATHRDLQAMVAQGSFRQDLYYRLAVVPVTVPPLRDRPEDIDDLLDHFLALVAQEMKVPRREATSAARECLRAYAFPGNIRELRNLIERAYILGRGESLDLQDLGLANAGIDAHHRHDLPESVSERLAPGLNLRETLEQIEEELLRRALREANGVQAEAGRALGLSRSDMVYKIRKYDLGHECR